MAKEGKEYTFVYEGMDRKGKKVSGEYRATSEIEAKMALIKKGVSIRKINKQRMPSGKKIKEQDIAVFARQLATMMKSGIPLLQAFEIVGNGHPNPSVGKLIFQIKSDVESGSNLKDAFSRHPKYFDPLFCNLLGAGEAAGILDTILDRIATYKEKMLGIKKAIKSALMYPIAVMGIATIVVSIIMIFVVPQFKETFSAFGAELPAPTLVVMAISDWFVHNYYIFFGAIFGAIFGVRKALKTSKPFKAKYDRMILKLPIFGPLIQKAVVARWARTLATMFSAGVPLVEALDSVAGASGNDLYYQATKKIQKDIAVGSSLGSSMQEVNIFPPMVIQMTLIGEESGSLDDMLSKVASFYEEEVDVAVAGLSKLMEPLIILILGVVIGGLVVAMYLPIFKMGSVV